VPQIDLQNVTLNYTLTGPSLRTLPGASNAPVLMFSNSLGTNLSMWDPQLELLEPHYRILRYDMRGHGSSSVPPGPYTVTQLGNDVIDLLNALKIETINFCGLSIGGIIGQWLGINAASRLNKLILCNTAAKIGTTETWNKRIAEVTDHGIAPIADGVVQRWFTTGFPAPHAPVVSLMKQMLLATNPAGYLASCAALRDNDLRDAISAIRLPVCVIAGDQDPVTTIADGQFIKDRIPGAELTVLPAAHISNAEVPELFSTTVLDFLTKDVHQ
jgi:3-oxoadipate enol-lactonase